MDIKRYTLLTVLLCVSATAFYLPALANEDDEAYKRGAYIFNLGGCASCHNEKDGKPLAGGLEMKSEFGSFYTPNITPNKDTGIGGWSDEDFIRAMTEGVAPDGSDYYPAFPYTSYSKMTRQDLLDLKHYLDKQSAVNQHNKEHDLNFPINFRSLLWVWKFFNFENKAFQIDNSQSKSWNRGAYIVNGPGHCVECHSPRNWMGAMDQDQLLAGNPVGIEGEAVPGLTKHKDNQISDWDDSDIIASLQMGMIPDGDFLGGSMGEVIENTTSKLTDADLRAIVDYLRSKTIP